MNLVFVCDNKRHLICLPYSIENLHEMGRQLGIDPCWFHRTKDLEHYDIPLDRIPEITSKCKVVSSKDIVRIIKGEKKNV